MDNTVYKGTISFINHNKKNAMIDYVAGGKKKTVSFKTGEKEDLSKDGKKIVKKQHHYRMGDEVTFKVKMNDRGDKMIAYDLKFMFNTSLEKLTQKAAVDNDFIGYLKIVDEDLYVKEMDSYLFFPLVMSKWEKAPPESAFNEAIRFRLLNMDKPNSIAAELLTHDFIPEFKKAQHHLKSKTPVEATVTRVSPYAAYLNLFGETVQGKLDVKADDPDPLKEGDTVKVIITYLTGSRIVIERAKPETPKE